MPNGPSGIVRFGVFEVDCAARELRKNGARIKLQDQPFDVLAALLDRPGEIVSRDELKERIWRDDTFVDFDHSLSEAINKIRRALGDSASNARFIETLPKRGYRFIGASRATSESWWRKHWRVLATAGVAAAILPAALLISGRVVSDSPVSEPPRAVPFTSYPGQELAPSFSPEGDRIAFTWNGEREENFDIFVKLIGAESQIRLTETPEDEFSPVWSPDGRQIAFLRGLSTGEFGVFLTPTLGGAERQITSIAPMRVLGEMYPTLDWTPDGQWLAAADRLPGDEQYSLVLISVSNGELRRMDSIPGSLTGDYDAAFSPDGSRMLFKSERLGDLYRVDLSKDQQVTGNPEHLTLGLNWPSAPAWTPDGRQVVFALGFKFRRDLWRVKVSAPGQAEQLPFFGADGSRPAISADGKRLAYAARKTQINIWRVELSGDGGNAIGTHRLVYSTGIDGHPDFSPDGSKIAFESNRSGPPEVWVADADGSNGRRLTDRNVAMTGSPRWSPGGDLIAFDSIVARELGIYIIRADGGAPRRIATGYGPEWSMDAKKLFYVCASPDVPEICQVPLSGGDPEQLTHSGGDRPQVSADGQWLYYSKDRKGVWRLQVGAGTEELVIPSVHHTAWTLAREGIYYFQRSQDTTSTRIMHRDFRTGKTREVHSISGSPIYAWLALSPDGRSILYDQFEQTSSDIMLVENFH